MAGLEKMTTDQRAIARDTLREAADLLRLLRMDPVQMKEANDMAQRCDVVAEKLRDDI